MKDLNFPDKSEHVFMFVWVMSVYEHRLQVIEYSQSTDLCGELVDDTGPECRNGLIVWMYSMILSLTDLPVDTLVGVVRSQQIKHIKNHHDDYTLVDKHTIIFPLLLIVNINCVI